MATETIMLKAKKNSDGTTTLKLKNKGGHHDWHDNDLSTNVHAGDTVEWEIQDSSISSVDNIYSKDGTSIFSQGPSKENGGNWSGTVNSNAADDTEESYSIDYTTSDGSYTDDPVLKVKAP